VELRTSDPQVGLSMYLLLSFGSIPVVAGARNHLQADRSLGFWFEIRI
jgi:hypothetical protein